MEQLTKEQVIGHSIDDVIVLLSKNPVDMSSHGANTTAISTTYLRLSNGVTLNLLTSEPPLLSAECEAIEREPRNTTLEEGFKTLIGGKITNVILSDYLPCIAVIVDDALIITMDAPTPFWVLPCLHESRKDSNIVVESKPFW